MSVEVDHGEAALVFAPRFQSDFDVRGPTTTSSPDAGMAVAVPLGFTAVLSRACDVHRRDLIAEWLRSRPLETASIWRRAVRTHVANRYGHRRSESQRASDPPLSRRTALFAVEGCES